MFDKFKQISELKAMRDQAMRVQKELEAEEIIFEENGVRIVMTGNQKIRQISVDGVVSEKLAKAVNKAVERSQQVAAKKIQSMGGMGALGELLGQ